MLNHRSNLEDSDKKINSISLEESSRSSRSVVNFHNNDNDEVAEALPEESGAVSSSSPQLMLNLRLPKSYKDIYIESLWNSLILMGINSTININIFVSGTIVKGIDRDTLAANSLIFSGAAALSILFSSPLTAINMAIGHLQGAKGSIDDSARILQAGWLTGVLFALPAVLISSINKPILLGFKQQENIANIVQDFFWLTLPGWFPFYLQFASGQFLSGLKKRFAPLFIDMGSLGLSIFLTYGFALGKFGFPELGIKGYGLSQSINNILIFIGYHIYLHFHKDFKDYHLHQIRPGIMLAARKLLQDGLPIMVAYLGEVGITLSAALMAGSLGEEQLITQNIFGSYLLLLTIPAVSLLESTCVLISGAMGAKEFTNINRYTQVNLALSLFSPSVMLILTCTIPKLLMSPFINPNDPLNVNIVNNLNVALPLLAAGNLFDASRFVLSGSLLGMRDLEIPTSINAGIQLLLMIPLMYALSYHTDLDVVGLVVAYLIGSALLTGCMSYRYFVTLMNLLPQEENIPQPSTIKVEEIDKNGNVSAVIPVEIYKRRNSSSLINNSMFPAANDQQMVVLNSAGNNLQADYSSSNLISNKNVDAPVAASATNRR